MRKTYNLLITKNCFAVFAVPLFLLTISCQNGPNGNELDDNQLQGNVTLENQTEHDGVIIYLAGADVGTVSDQDGDYLLTIPDTIDISGVFSLYFYHAYYTVDSLLVEIDGNAIVSGSQGVSNTNTLADRVLNQIIKVSMSFNDSSFVDSDTLLADIYITNVSDSPIIMRPRHDQRSTEVRDWVVYNILGREHSVYHFEEDLAERSSDTLSNSEELYVSFWFAFCTPGAPSPPCNPSAFEVEPGEYYFVPNIHAEKGYYHSGSLPKSLLTYMWTNHKSVIDEIFYAYPKSLFDRMGFPMFTIN